MGDSKQIHLDNGADKMGMRPVGSLLISMAWPAILSMTIYALYNVVDSIFVAHMSKAALTAVSFVMPMQLLMISVTVGSGVGVNSLISRRLGEKNRRAADDAANTSIMIGLINFLIFLVVGLIVTEPFMRSYTADPEIYGYGIQYMFIVMCFSFFSSIEIQLEKVLQSTGNMTAPMICSLAGAVTNIILDPIMIFGLLGFPRLGVAGAAVATVIGQVVSFIAAVTIIVRKEHAVTVRIRGFKPNLETVRDIYAVGFPSMIMQAIGSFMLIGFNAILAKETTAVAVLGIYFKLQSFVFMPVFGLNQGAMPVMGYNYGAKNRERLMHTYRLGLTAAIVIMAAGCLLFHLIPGVFLRMFDADNDMLEVGEPALRIISLCFLPAAFGIMTSTLFQATGHGFYSLFGSLLRQLVGILPLAFILYHTFGVSKTWFAFPLAEISGLFYSAIMLTHLYRKEIAHLAHS